MLFWNNCLRYPYALGGRHVLHGAVSDDDGANWRGFREVYHDPRNHQPPDIHHDYGTAYPYPVATPTGRVLLATGQGHAATVLRVDPDWLAEPSERIEYEEGLQGWSTFGTRGVEVIASAGREYPVLRIARLDPGWPAVAVRNIPHATWGFVVLEILLPRGCGSAQILLTDHFSPPFDYDDELHAVFAFHVHADDASASGCTALTPAQWHTLVFRWDLQAGSCVLREGGQTLEVQREQRRATGISYLRFRSPASEGGVGGQGVAGQGATAGEARGTAEVGFLVGRIRAESLDRAGGGALH